MIQEQLLSDKEKMYPQVEEKQDKLFQKQQHVFAKAYENFK